jgi:hypothetical protein
MATPTVDRKALEEISRRASSSSAERCSANREWLDEPDDDDGTNAFSNGKACGGSYQTLGSVSLDVKVFSAMFECERKRLFVPPRR